MKLVQLKCPDCGGAITMDITGRETAFCPYCGNQFSVVNPNKFESHTTKNVNINKNINVNKTNKIMNNNRGSSSVIFFLYHIVIKTAKISQNGIENSIQPL